MKKKLVLLDFRKAPPGPQKIRCSQLEQNCSSKNFFQKVKIIFQTILGVKVIRYSGQNNRDKKYTLKNN
jgi:hypothetical protein